MEMDGGKGRLLSLLGRGETDFDVAEHVVFDGGEGYGAEEVYGGTEIGFHFSSEVLCFYLVCFFPVQKNFPTQKSEKACALLLTEESGGRFGGLEELAGRDALVVGVNGHVGEGPLQRVEPGPAWGDLNCAGHFLRVWRGGGSAGEEFVVRKSIRFGQCMGSFFVSLNSTLDERRDAKIWGICPN
jgi:hypothetical protein